MCNSCYYRCLDQEGDNFKIHLWMYVYGSEKLLLELARRYGYKIRLDNVQHYWALSDECKDLFTDENQNAITFDHPHQINVMPHEVQRRPFTIDDYME